MSSLLASPTTLLPSLLMAIAAGAVIPLQAGANGGLGRALGHPLWATLVSLLVSLVAVAVVLAALRVPLPAAGAAAGIRGWMWSGGLLGAFYITAALVLAPRLGAGSFIAAVVAGQMLAALAADQFGLAGFAVRELTGARLGGALLVVLGVAVMQWGGTAGARAAAGA